MNVRLPILAFALAIATNAAAADAPRADAERRAGEAYLSGVKLSALQNWGEALLAFELADSLVHHPQSTYNIGVCERNIGHYTRARANFLRALADHQVGNAGKLLPQDERSAHNHLEEIERYIARVTLKLSPPNAAVMVDGRPLAKTGANGSAEWIANLENPGIGKTLDSSEALLILDPGTHVFTFSRKGYRDVLKTEKFTPGERVTRSYELERLPSTMFISSDRANAVVTVDGLDVGTAPVTIERPAGKHVVLVRSRGYVPYQVSVTLGPGEQSNLRATLPEERPNILTRWWFWATAGAVVAGVTAATYAATRPEPGQTPTNCGSTGWCVQVP